MCGFGLIRLAHLCLGDSRMRPTPCLLTLTVLVLTDTETHSSPGFCFILVCLLVGHPLVKSNQRIQSDATSVCSQSDHFPGFHSAVSRLCFVPVAALCFPGGLRWSAPLLLQLQECRVGLLEVLLQLQSQVVNANAGAWGHAALRRLRGARGGGAVQNKAHHDDGER